MEISRENLNTILELHKKWLNNKEDGKRANLSGADLSDADIKGANLKGAELRDVDLKGADLDYSCLPLWCDSLAAHFDDRQLIQIAYHLVKAGLQSKNASKETKAELNKLVDFANKFHMVEECGEISSWEVKHEANM